jgi:nitric oxide reductase subunit B
MVLLSLLPIGLLQTFECIDKGLWSARSADFLQTDLMQTLKWMRAVGDSVFAIGILALVYFIAGLKCGWSLEPSGNKEVSIAAGLAPASGE